MEGADFLRQKYTDLNTSPEVVSAAKRTEKRTEGEIKLPLGTSEEANKRIENYLNRLSEIVNNPNKEKREQGLNILKSILAKEYVIKEEDIPEAYFESVKNRAKEEGREEILTAERRAEIGAVVIADQKSSLNRWIDYLASSEANFPDWLKYMAVRSVLHMGRYDRVRQTFTERTGGTVAPFPEINLEALHTVLSDIEKTQAGANEAELSFFSRHDITPEIGKKYYDLLKNKNFSKLYAFALEEFKPISDDLLKITEGEWVEYPQGSDPRRLVDSISDYGTGWCLRAEKTAEDYLNGKSLQVFYSLNKEGKPVVPRAVIVVNYENKIEQVRGVAYEENLDEYIGDVVQAKLSERPDAQSYQEKYADMKLLTSIDKKTKNSEVLTPDEIAFVYEINKRINSFGLQDDPRIEEIRDKRNTKKDLGTVFNCSPQEIATNINELGQQTLVFYGNLNIKQGEYMQNLTHPLFVHGNLELTDNLSITKLPDNLVVSRDVDLGGCTNLAVIPDSIFVNGALKVGKPESTFADIFSKIRKLDGTFDKVKVVDGCDSLREIPSNIYQIVGDVKYIPEKLEPRFEELKKSQSGKIGKPVDIFLSKLKDK